MLKSSKRSKNSLIKEVIKDSFLLRIRGGPDQRYGKNIEPNKKTDEQGQNQELMVKIEDKKVELLSLNQDLEILLAKHKVLQDIHFQAKNPEGYQSIL